MEEDKHEQQEKGDTDPKALCCNDCGKLFSSVVLAQLHATKSGHQDFSESAEDRPELSSAEKAVKLEELRQKLAEKRKWDALKAAEEAREAERMRRKSGQTSAEARREIKEREMIKAADQLRRDREEDRQIRAKIRAEIEEEKKSRKAAALAEETRPVVMASEPIKLVSQDSGAVRIQVKLPGGQALKAVFKSDDCLSMLRDKISEQVALTSASRLTISFPHTIINIEEHQDTTFTELGLCPSASLVLEQ